MWTAFFDMSSGGSEKTEWESIYIELENIEAIEYFENRFNIDTSNVTCSCCGPDFSIHKIEGEPTQKDGVLIITNEVIVSADKTQQRKQNE